VLVFKRHAVVVEKGCSKFHNSLNGLNDFAVIISTFIGRFRQYPVLENCRHSSSEIMSFIGTRERKSAL